MLDIVASHNCVQFHRKLTNQTRENGKKPDFGPDFGPFGPNWGCHFFFFFFFFKNLALSVTRYHHQLSSCTILEKTSDTILRKLNEKWMDGWTRLIL